MIEESRPATASGFQSAADAPPPDRLLYLFGYMMNASQELRRPDETVHITVTSGTETLTLETKSKPSTSAPSSQPPPFKTPQTSPPAGKQKPTAEEIENEIIGAELDFSVLNIEYSLDTVMIRVKENLGDIWAQYNDALKPLGFSWVKWEKTKPKTTKLWKWNP